MNTTRNTVVIVLLFAAAAFIGGYLWNKSVDNDEEATPTPTVTVRISPTVSPRTPTPTVVYKPQVYTVSYNSAGATPKTLTIHAGDAVIFKNTTATEVWPASDPHPTHSLCAGFDARRGLKNGEEYTLTFPDVKTCTYHSHLDPLNTALRGTIIVQ